MKKSSVLKAVSVVLALITVFSIACAITASGSGFLDLSNIARAACVAVAVFCGIFAVITWKYAKSGSAK